MAAEQVLVNGVTEIIKKVVPIIAQQISSSWGVKDELRKLKDTLESIQALMSDAERKQVNDEAVRLWLRRLKDVVYDADDVMDEFAYEAMRRDAVGSQLKQKVRALASSSNPLVFRFKMAREIRSINQKLDEIHKNSERFRLENTGTAAQENQNRELIKKRNWLTTSDLDDSLVLGREGAKLEILNLLVEKPSPSLPSSSSEIVTPRQNVSTLSTKNGLYSQKGKLAGPNNKIGFWLGQITKTNFGPGYPSVTATISLSSTKPRSPSLFN